MSNDTKKPVETNDAEIENKEVSIEDLDKVAGGATTIEVESPKGWGLKVTFGSRSAASGAEK